MKRSVVLDVTVIVFLSLLFFTLDLPEEFIAFKARFALFAQHLYSHGITLFPVLYQKAYPDYLITPLLPIYLLSKLYGKVTPFTVIFPTAIVSTLILIVIYATGCLRSRLWGIYGVLFAFLTFAFIESSRSVSPDLYIMLISSLCFYIQYSSDVTQKQGRLQWLPVLWIIGFCFRGPIGFLIPAAVTCSYSLYQGHWKKFFAYGLLAALLFIVVFECFLLLTYMQGGLPLVHRFIEAQILGRVSLPSAAQPLFFYWYQSLGYYALSYPLAILVLCLRIKPILEGSRENDRFLGYLACWFLVILLGMSIPACKKMRYLLPMVPAIALMAAYVFVNRTPNGIFAMIRFIVTKLCDFLPYLLLVGVFLAYIFIPSESIFQLKMYYPIIGIILLIVLIGKEIFRYIFRGKPDSQPILSLLFAVVSVLSFHALVIEPLNYQLEKTKPFVEQIETRLQSHSNPVIFYRLGPDQEDIKLIVNMKIPLNPLFISDAKALMGHPEAYVITSEEQFAKMDPELRQHFQVLHHGNIGHRKCVLLEWKI